MRGLLADANVEGHQARIRELLEQSALWEILADRGVESRLRRSGLDSAALLTSPTYPSAPALAGRRACE